MTSQDNGLPTNVDGVSLPNFIFHASNKQRVKVTQTTDGNYHCEQHSKFDPYY